MLELMYTGFRVLGRALMIVIEIQMRNEWSNGNTENFYTLRDTFVGIEAFVKGNE